jgi:hypothetical protein
MVRGNLPSLTDRTIRGVAMASFGKRVDGPGGRRRIRRRLVSIPAIGSGGDESRYLIIEDMCLSGVRVVGCELPAEGSKILLRSGERAIAGRIVWALDDRRGIVFDGVRR